MKQTVLLIWSVIAALSAGTLSARAEAAVTPAVKPNIIFILTDDQGYGDLGRHGHPLLKTPHTDRLYDESVRFDNFYVSPACSPTRAALLTGMHEFRNGVTHTLEPREHLYKDAVLLPQLLKTAGYTTGFIGKWHLSSRGQYGPQYRGFDWCSTNPQGPRKHFDPEIIRNNVRTQREGYREDIFFDEAMTFIDESGDQPFFCYLSTYSPHTPLAAPEEFIAPYRDDVSDKHATYLGMVANIDYNVGRLLEFLKKRELEENTIIVFMNDNGQTEGLDVYNAGMRGCKCTVWEGGSRAMSFWRWPNKWKPHKVDNLTAHLDVLPTLCELAGVSIPAELQAELEGFSLLPLLESEQPIRWHDNRMLFHHVGRWPSGTAAAHKHAMCGVRKGNHLLLRSHPCDDPECAKYQSQCTTLRQVRKGLKSTTYTNGNAQFHWGVSPAGRWALFDVKSDPACEKDLAATSPKLVSTMAAAYDEWWDAMYPVMIERGGDLGDPNASAQAASRDAQTTAVKASVPDATADTPADAADTPADAAKNKTPIFQHMDANADQQVTKKEYVGLFMGTFPRQDTDGDGALSVKEFDFPVAFKHADTDQDGTLTREEFRVLYAKQFTRRDRNQDGVLTADEMKSNANARSSVAEDTQYSVLDIFPDSGVRSTAGSTSCSFSYAPSGSKWNSGLDEKQVFLAAIQGENWRLGVGKGGHIYSLRGPYGESVPPQRAASPWNDEVWQAVITSEVLADPIHAYNKANPGVWGDVFPLLCFIHQAGIYVKREGNGAPAPFYSPCLRKRWDPETKTLELVSWMQQANAPCVWKSFVLIYTAFRDLGHGTIEVNQVLHSFGGIPLDYLSTPWGGVRKSSLPHTIVSKANGSWAEETGLWNWDNVPERRMHRSGGWAAWVQDPKQDASPALGMVFGTQHVQGIEDRPADLVDVEWRVEGERKFLWGTAGSVNGRDYEAAEQVTKLAVKPGESYSIRWFLISGNFADVRKMASKLSGYARVKPISFDDKAIQSVWMKDGKLSTEGSGDRWAGFLAYPVKGSVPVFLLEHIPTGQQIVTADIYALAPSEPFKNPLPKDHPEHERYQNRRVYKPYSPHIGYENLLGYAYAQKPADRPVRRIETPDGINLHASAQCLWLPE